MQLPQIPGFSQPTQIAISPSAPASVASGQNTTSLNPREGDSEFEKLAGDSNSSATKPGEKMLSLEDGWDKPSTANPIVKQTPQTDAQRDAAAKEKEQPNDSKESPEEVEGEDEGETVEKGKEADEESEDDETTATDAGDPIKDKDVAKIHGNTKRDYTGFNQEEINLLKRLDNSRFTKLAPHWKALKDAAGKSVELAQELVKRDELLKTNGIPQQWHEHPDAWQLNPEIRGLQAEFAQQGQLEQFYTQQLLNIKDGKPWLYITGKDTNGQFQYSPEQQPTNAAELWLSQQLQSSTQTKMRLEAKAGEIQKSFRGSYDRATQEIKTEVDKFTDNMPAHLKPVDADIKLVSDAIPKQYRDHPLAYGLTKVAAANLQLARHIQKLEGVEIQKKKLEADKRLAGPNASKAPKEPSKTNRSKGDTLLNIKDIDPGFSGF